MKKRTTGSFLPARYMLAISMCIGAVESSTAQTRSAEGSRRIIEEVIVTAEHREATLQDTQISLTAFSGDDIKDLGIGNASDIGQYTPNIEMTPMVGGRNGFAVTMRGVGNREPLPTFDPAVGVYMDGVLIGKNAGAVLDVVDPQRIEVLRGPQGTLYGRNTIGGAINVVTKKPTDEFEGSFGVTTGNYHQRHARAVINIPMLGPDRGIGSLNLRASAAALNRDGFYDNRFADAPQGEVQEMNRDVGLVHLQWQPITSLNVLYSYDRTEIDEAPIPFFVTFVNPDHPTGGDLEPYQVEERDRPSSGEWDGEFFGESEVTGHALNLTFELSDQISLHSISSARKAEMDGGQDADGAPILRLHTRDTAEFQTITQELRLVGSAFDARLDYVVGAFYYEEEGELRNTTIPYVSLAPGVEVIVDRTDDAEFDVRAQALYTQATFALTSRWDVTAGIRYTEEERSMSKVRTDILTSAALGIPLTTTVTDYPEVEKNFDNISPVVSTGYNWTDSIMTYAKVSRGYQSGGFASRDGDPEDFARGFDEEFLTAYEVGWKTTFFNQRVRFNGAVFFSDYDDKQVNQFNPETQASVIRNAGVVEIRGMELELNAFVTDHIELGLSYGYTDPEYVEYTDGEGNDLTDSNFPYTPKHNGHAYARYEFPRLAVGLLSARVDWSYRDAITFLLPAPEINSGRSRQLWDARVTLSEIAGPGDTSMRISLWGKNLTDEGYWNFGVDVFGPLGFAINTYGDPRTYGIDFDLAF